VARLAGGLRDLGVGPGDRVATFCWNHDRHLETYFASALMGASYHTLNIRLAGRAEGRVTAAGVPPGPRPLGLTVPDQIELHRHPSQAGTVASGKPPVRRSTR